MGPLDLGRLESAKASGIRTTGTVSMRTRTGVTGRRPRANTRFDGVASCLVTPQGAASSQIIIETDDDVVRTRFMTAAEGARLMGIPPDYRLPRSYKGAFKLFGDGVAVPAVRHRSEHLLEPLAAATRSLRPRTEVSASADISGPEQQKPPRSVKRAERPGLKGSTVGTTLYLKPEESKRVRKLALELDLPA